jgi:hypothetical protein
VGWVPPNTNDNGPNDPLHKLNLQNAYVKYNPSADLAMPSYDFHGAPFEVEAAYSNHLDDAYEQRDITADAMRNPDSVLDEDVNMDPDGYGLPRPVSNQCYHAIVKHERSFLAVRARHSQVYRQYLPTMPTLFRE